MGRIVEPRDVGDKEEEAYIIQEWSLDQGRIEL